MSLKVVIDGAEYIKNPSQPAVSTLTDEEKQLLASVIDDKGFDYGMVYYSDFRAKDRKRVNDERFHQLRDAFCGARKELESYLREHGALPE